MVEETVVNTLTAGNQNAPVITKLSSGSWVVIWQTDTNSGDLHGQLFDATGAKQGGEFAVNSTTSGGQFGPAAAATPDGGFIVAWQDGNGDGGDIHTQKFNAGATMVGSEITVPTNNSDYQFQPGISVAADGSYLISWTTEVHSQYSFGDYPWVARFDAAGNRLGADLNVSSIAGAGADWVALSAGHYVVAYSDGSNVLARFVDIDASGVHAATPFVLNDSDQTIGTPYNVSLVKLSDGSFAAAWSSYINSGGFFSTFGIASRTFDATGTHGSVGAVSQVGGFNGDVHLAALADGYVVSWGAYTNGNSADGTSSFARVFDHSGDAIGDRFTVNTSAVGAYAGASIIGLASGQFVGVYTGNEILTRTFDAPVKLLGGTGNDHLIAPPSTTPSELNGLDGNDTLDGNAVSNEMHGGNGNDTVNGNDGNDLLSGDAGGDTLSGGAGDDRIFAAQPWVEKTYTSDIDSGMDRGTEIDTLSGGDGNDSLFAGTGDNVDGGAGQDTLYLSVRNATAGVHLDLSTTTSQVTAGGTIAGVELLGRFDGSDFADTVVAGTAGTLQYTSWDTIGSVYGYGGDDKLTAGFYTPNLYGGDGNDTLIGAATTYPNQSILIGGAGADTITAGPSGSLLSSGDGTTDNGLYYFAGGQLSAPVVTPDQLPVFDHGSEIDRMFGGAGDDVIMIGWGDSADGGAQASRGDALVLSMFGATTGVTVDFGQPGQLLSLGGGTITGFERIDWIQGSQYGDTISFNNPPNTGTMGALSPGYENVLAGGGSDNVKAGYYTQFIDGGDGNDTLDGRNSQYLNLITGGAGDDTIYSGSSATVSGGAGNDTIYAGGGSVFGEEGNDRIILTTPSSYWANVQGGAGNDEIQASSGGGNFSGNDGADILTGDTGTDFLYSNAYTLNNNGQRIVVDDVGTEHDVITAGDGNDTVAIGYGDDANGGTGTDTLMLSLAGATTGVTLDTASLVGANPSTLGGGTIQGFETLASLRGTEFNDFITVAAQATPVTINGAAGDDTLTATSGTVTLQGGDGNDRLIGGTGADFLDGGAGIDQADYHTATASVTVQLGLTDTAIGTATGGDHLRGIENVTGSDFADMLIGGNGDNVLVGGGGNDTIVGGGGADRIEGGTGADAMSGGTGDDSYVVDDAGDTVFETVGQGTDRVATTVSWAMAAGQEIEQLTVANITSVNAVDLTGNEFANKLAGNDGANTLNGGGGNDKLAGAGGNDILDGGTGADQMQGGTGSDSYIVDDAADTVFEANSGGVDYDTVMTTVSWALGAGQEVERLRASPGTNPINLTGNDYAQKMQGNEGDNILTGGGGNDGLIGGGGADVLIGGTGLDKLTGGLGADTFVFEHGGQMDQIVDFAVGTDKADLTAFGLTWQDVQAAMTESNGNTILTLGGGDSVVFAGVSEASLSASDFLLGGNTLSNTLQSDMWDGGSDDMLHTQIQTSHAMFEWHML